MEGAAVLENPGNKNIIENRKKCKGIIGFKGLMAAIDKAIDGVKDRIDTKKATKQYEEIRSELLSQGTGYTEEKYLENVKRVNAIKDLTENDNIHMSEDILNGKTKEDGKNRKREEKKIARDLIKDGFQAVTGASLIGTILKIFGITSPPVSTIVSGVLVGAEALYSYYKLSKTKNFTSAEREEQEARFKELFTPLIEDVKKLCDELEKEKANDIDSLKNIVNKKDPDEKRVTAKEFKKAFAIRAVEIMEKLNLKTLKVGKVMEAFGIEDDIENLKEEQKAKDAEAAQKIDMRVFEETQKQEAEEQARRMAEEQKLREQKEVEERLNNQRGQD